MSAMLLHLTLFSAGAVRSRERVFKTLPHLSSALKHIYELRRPLEL